MIPGDDRERVDAERLEPPLHAGEGGVDAQDEVAVLGPGARQELGRVGARERPDQHRSQSRDAFTR